MRKAKEAYGLQRGNKVNDFEATDIHGGKFKLSEALKNGPLVVIFYRGQWCPFCNKHLKALQKELFKIHAKGANVVAISPETSQFLKQTLDKTGVEFKLLHDKDYHISELFDLTFTPGGMEKFMVNTLLGAKLKKAHGNEEEKLPIPATFIIDQNHKIVWRHFDPDYKKRSKLEDIIKNIPLK